MKLLVPVEDLVGDRDGGVVPVGGVASCPFRFVSGEADDEGSVVVCEHGEDSQDQVVGLRLVSDAGFGHVGEVIGGLDAVADEVELGAPSELGEVVHCGHDGGGSVDGEAVEPSEVERMIPTIHIVTLSVMLDICQA